MQRLQFDKSQSVSWGRVTTDKHRVWAGSSQMTSGYNTESCSPSENLSESLREIGVDG